MKKTIFLLAVFAAWAVATILNQPTGAGGATTTKQAIFAGAAPEPRVLSIFERSCQNCHSANTEWPVYSRIFPASLLIKHDVEEARSHMDLSRWPSYDDTEKRLILAEIGVAVRNGSMPPRRYTLLHPEAKLNKDEANEIYQWARSSRKLLKQESEIFLPLGNNRTTNKVVHCCEVQIETN